MNRAINGGNVARMYQERGDGFSSTELASVASWHLHSLKSVSKVRTPLVRILLFCLGALLTVTAWGQDHIPSFIAEGTISTKAFRPSGTNYLGRIDGKFWFCYSNGIWHVQFAPQYTYPIPIKTEDESIEDWKPIPNGTRAIVTFIHHTNSITSDGVPIRPFAEATRNMFPIASKKGLFLPWLSLCPRPELPLIGSNSIRFNFQLRFAEHPQNIGTFRANYIEPQNAFLAQLDITNNGSAFDVGGSSFKYKEPYKEGFREHSYRVLETTNYQGITFPIHTVLSGFSPLPNGKSAEETYPSTITELYVQKYDFTCSNLMLVPVPNMLVAIDYRFSTNDAVHVNYAVTNDQWGSVTNERLQKFTKKIEQAAHNGSAIRDNHPGRRFVIIAALFLLALMPAIFLALRFSAKKQQNKK